MDTLLWVGAGSTYHLSHPEHQQKTKCGRWASEQIRERETIKVMALVEQGDLKLCSHCTGSVRRRKTKDDKQRVRLYRAEREVFTEAIDKGDLDGSFEQAEVFANKVAQSSWVKKNVGSWTYEQKRFRIDHSYQGRIRSHAGALYTQHRGRWYPTLFIARYHRYHKWVLLHEMAHWFAGPGNWHGPRFARIYLGLVRRFLGPEQARALRAAYSKHRVKYRQSSRG